MKICLLTAGLAISVLSYAHPVHSRKGHIPPVFNDSITTASIPSMPDMMEQILEVLGLHANFELKAANVSNIEATIKRGKRVILYNPDYIEWLNKATGDKWGALALIAHEIGHHLNGHTMRKGGSRPSLELEADEFSGFVLRQLGASLEESQRVMKFIAKTKTSKTHPARKLRMAAIKKGWERSANN